MCQCIRARTLIIKKRFVSEVHDIYKHIHAKSPIYYKAARNISKRSPFIQIRFEKETFLLLYKCIIYKYIHVLLCNNKYDVLHAKDIICVKTS